MYYEVDGCEYAYLPNFRKYQYMTKTFPSKLPPPPEGSKLITGDIPVNNKLITRATHLYGIEVEVDNGIDNEVEVGNNNDLLKELYKLPKWGKSHAKEDAKWLNEFLIEFPAFSLSHIRACRDYHSSKSKHNAGTWKNSLRNWMVKASEFKEKDGKDKRFSGSHHERVPKQYESTEELRAFLDD